MGYAFDEGWMRAKEESQMAWLPPFRAAVEEAGGTWTAGMGVECGFPNDISEHSLEWYRSPNGTLTLYWYPNGQNDLLFAWGADVNTQMTYIENVTPFRFAEIWMQPVDAWRTSLP